MTTPDLLAHRYRPVRLLGEGAMGTVWLVDDTATGRRVALKAIKKSLGGGDKPLLRFKQEFRLMAQLRHPNCCEVYDYGVLEDDRPYFTMEVIEGHDLSELIPLQPARFADVLTQLALALGYLHQRGFVHRDLKPANARLRSDGVVKLMDYGLMEYAGRAGMPIAGTIGYLAPEIVNRGPVDGRADLYALGCMSYELLTGQPPFTGEGNADVLRQHLTVRPQAPSLRRSGLDPAHERLVLRLLEKDPLARPQTAADVLNALGVAAPPGIGGNVLAAPLVGRDALVTRIDEAIAEVATGSPGRIWLLHGPPGVGKSRLLAEARCRAQLAGLACGAGQAEHWRAEPYGPLIMVLRELLSSLRELAPGALAQHAPVLRTLLPELDAPLAPPLHSPAKEKQRLQGALADLLAALALVRPVLLTIEDWHWVDPLTIEALAQLQRAAPAARILVVLSSRRPEEAGPAWLEAVEQIPVGPLGAGEVRRMIGAMLPGGTADPHLPQQLGNVTGGVPFDVERTLERLAETGDLSREPAGWVLRPGALDGLDPATSEPDDVPGLAELPEAARTVAHIAALAGPACDLALVQAVACFEDAELFDAVERLRAARILEGADDGRLAFTHDRYRDRLHGDVPPDERVFLHGLLVRALEERLPPADLAAASGPPELVAELAAHALQSGDRQAIQRWALPAARRQFALYSLADAERHAAAGLAATPEPGATRRRYLELLGDLLRTVGRHDQASQLYDEAVELVAATGAPDRARLITSRALLAIMAADYRTALEGADRGAAAAEAEGRPDELARALLCGCRARLYLGETAAALEGAKRAVAAAREGRHETWTCESLAFLGHLTITEGGDVEAALAMLREACGTLAQLGEQLGQINVLSLLGDALLQLGEPTEAHAAFMQVRDLAALVGQPEELEFAYVNLAVAALDRGALDACLKDARSGWLRSLERNAAFPGAMGLMLEAAARAARGEPLMARIEAARALELAATIDNAYLERLLAPMGVDVALEAGRTADAEDMLARAGDAASPPVDAARARVALARGDHAEARRQAERARDAARAARHGLEEARALDALARAFLAADQPGEARAAAAAGYAIAEARGAALMAADLAMAWGEAELLAGGDAASRFAAAARHAETAGSKPRLALIRFAQACAAPDSSRAEGQVTEAHALIAAVAADLPETEAAAYRARPDVARALAGDFRAARRAAPAEIPVNRFPMGFGPP